MMVGTRRNSHIENKKGILLETIRTIPNTTENQATIIERIISTRRPTTVTMRSPPTKTIDTTTPKDKAINQTMRSQDIMINTIQDLTIEAMIEAMTEITTEVLADITIEEMRSTTIETMIGTMIGEVISLMVKVMRGTVIKVVRDTVIEETISILISLMITKIKGIMTGPLILLRKTLKK